MPKEDPARPNEDARAVEEKFGAFAKDYVESRSDAADMAGNEAGKVHWEKVAAAVKADD